MYGCWGPFHWSALITATHACRAARTNLRDGLLAGTVAGIVGGAPSTIHALASGGDPLEATLVAGSLLLPRAHRTSTLLGAALSVHLAVSVAWGYVLAATLPRRHTTAAGAVAGLAIAALDLGLIGRRIPRIRALPSGPQVADHLGYGAAVGAILSYRRARCAHPRHEITSTRRSRWSRPRTKWSDSAPSSKATGS